MSNRKTGMGGHQSAAAQSVIWLTPPHIIKALGPFDLDPCAAPDPRPWPTAATHYTLPQDGLALPWFGRVWFNPPYGAEAETWLDRAADYGRATGLIFARTETDSFFRTVWDRADALLFLRGRLFFHHPDGRRAAHNGGAPSVLIAYGRDDAEILHDCGLDGAFVGLKAPVLMHLVLAHANDDPRASQTWREAVVDVMRRMGGKARLPDLYAALEDHPKTAANENWRAKIRQTVGRMRLQRTEEPAQYALAV
jgi:hypothetical protein